MLHWVFIKKFQKFLKRQKMRFVNIFENYAKIMDFLQLLYEIFWKISKISQNFPKIRVFQPNERKINAWFVNFCWKICLKNSFLAIFLRNFFKIFEISPASGGSAPRDPPRAWPPKVFPPPEPKSWLRHCSGLWLLNVVLY